MTTPKGYGIDINTLGDFISRPAPRATPWGQETLIFERDEFIFRRVDIGAHMQADFLTGAHELTIFVEEGEVEVNGTRLVAQQVLSLPPRSAVKLRGIQQSALYFFEGPQDKSFAAEYGKALPTTDVREKYWGRIESMMSRAYTGKRIFCLTGKHASLEYHCRKVEGYYVHSGSLLLRLRAGRGEDRLYEIAAGQAVFIPPGLMHQRGGRKDATIMEISTADDDADSFLVEDGQRTQMPGLL